MKLEAQNVSKFLGPVQFFGLFFGFLFELPVGLLIGIFFNLTGGPFQGQLIGLIGGPFSGLIGGLISGFPTSRQLDNDSRVLPHEGYRRSKRYALVSGVLTGLPSGLLLGLVGALLFGLVGGLTSGLTSGLFFGLNAAVQHDILRFHLWRAQLFPWNVLDFLENARARHLLLRVGGSYSFIHQLLLSHFADLDLEPIPASTQPVAVQAVQFTPPPLS